MSSRMRPEAVSPFRSATFWHSIRRHQRSPSENTLKNWGMGLSFVRRSGFRSSGRTNRKPPSAQSTSHTARYPVEGAISPRKSSI